MFMKLEVSWDCDFGRGDPSSGFIAKPAFSDLTLATWVMMGRKVPCCMWDIDYINMHSSCGIPDSLPYTWASLVMISLKRRRDLLLCVSCSHKYWDLPGFQSYKKLANLQVFSFLIMQLTILSFMLVFFNPNPTAITSIWWYIIY